MSTPILPDNCWHDSDAVNPGIRVGGGSAFRIAEELPASHDSESERLGIETVPMDPCPNPVWHLAGMHWLSS